MNAIDRAKAWLAQRGPLSHNENSVVVRDLVALCERLREHARHDEGCSGALRKEDGSSFGYRCRCGWDEVEKLLAG